jgi:hypothetical protein
MSFAQPDASASIDLSIKQFSPLIASNVTTLRRSQPLRWRAYFKAATH